MVGLLLEFVKLDYELMRCGVNLNCIFTEIFVVMAGFVRLNTGIIWNRIPSTMFVFIPWNINTRDLFY